MEDYKILLAEDEIFLGHVLKEYLQTRGFILELVTDGKRAYSKFQEFKPDICLFDLNMPEQDGFSLTEDIRKINASIPIIIISANISSEDIIKTFEMGANDYMKKPFSMEELVGRINGLLKRSFLVKKEYKNYIGSLYFDSNTQELSSTDEMIRLTFRESNVLRLLMEKKNDVLNRKKVLEELWGEDNSFNARSLDVFISRLRKRFRNEHSVDIVNIRGVGYKIICADQ